MAKKEESTPDINSLMLDYMNEVLEECEKKEAISSTVDTNYFLSTGLLMYDMILNGGIRSGWTTSLGKEQSGKTSLAVKIMGSLAKNNIPGYFIDAEGSLNTEYACAIAGINDIEEYFGRKSPTGKGYEILPKIRYTDENGMEKVARFMQRILLALPDKKYRQETKKWYYVFDVKNNKSDKEKYEKLKLKYDMKLYSATGKYWCEAPDGKFQVVFLLDSLPGLVPENVGEEVNDKGQAMAADARAISTAMKPIRGLLRRKHAVFLPINQLREKPAVMFGNPEYEPMGNFVKFASDVRNQLDSRVVPDWFQRGKIDGKEVSTFGQEPSVEGAGLDMYSYKLIKNIKNKNGVAYRRGWVRIWNEDCRGKCRGFDDVFDTLEYLEYTKQIKLLKTGGRREISGLEKFIPQLEGKVVAYLDFKRYILGKLTNNESLLKQFIENNNLSLEVKDLPDIRSICFDQIQTGEAFNLLLITDENTVNEIQDSEDIEFDESDNVETDFDEDDFEG